MGRIYKFIDDLSHWVRTDNNNFQIEEGILVNSDIGGHLITKKSFSDFKILFFSSELISLLFKVIRY